MPCNSITAPLGEGFYRELVEQTEDLITIVDREGKILFVNKAAEKVYGHSQEECIDKPVFSFIHPDDSRKTQEAFQDWLARGVDSTTFENRQLSATGRVIHMYWTISFIRDDRGELKTVKGIARDITQLKEMESQLKQKSSELNKRVKELTCLYRLAEVVEEPGTDIPTIMTKAVQLLPSGWKYSNIASARIVIEGREYIAPGFNPSPWRISRRLMVNKEEIGEVEIYYHEKMPDADEGPFSKDERSLLNAIAERLSRAWDRIRTQKLLKEHKDSLEELVAQRTAELEHKINEIEKREETITQQAVEIMELSTPVIQAWEGLVVVPMIGILDSQRTQQLLDRFLEQVVETKASIALMDITGVPTIDTQTAHHLIEAVTSARLLGTRVIITGVRASIAQTLVQLGVDLSWIETNSSLISGMRSAFRQLGYRISGGMSSGMEVPQ